MILAPFPLNSFSPICVTSISTSSTLAPTAGPVGGVVVGSDGVVVGSDGVVVGSDGLAGYVAPSFATNLILVIVIDSNESGHPV